MREIINEIGCNMCEIDTPPILEDINEFSYVPMMSQTTFDCICLQDEQEKIDSGVSMSITSIPPVGCSYTSGEEICIDKIYLNYEFIGLTVGSIVTTLDTTSITFNNLGPAYVATYQGHTITLYDSYNATVSLPTYCREEKNVKGIKTRIIEQGIGFVIASFRLGVGGKIGCIPFTATAPGYTGPITGSSAPMSLFNEVDFFGRICLPTDTKKVTISDEFECCLSVDCIKPTGTYNGSNTIEVDIDYAFKAKKKIYSTIMEQCVINV